MNHQHWYSRRAMLSRASTGFGLTALSAMKADRAGAAESPFAARPSGYRSKVRSVIFAYMSGGVSHVDSFDPKPELAKRHGQPMPVPVKRTMFNNNGNIMASPFEFKKHGQSGIEISDMFPCVAKCADDLAVVRSMTSKVNEHAQGNYFFHCTQPFSGFPSAGSWVTYGLGSEADNLPGFVVLSHGNVPHGGVGLWGSGFLPAVHQASIINPDGKEPLNNVTPREADAMQRRRLELMGRLDSKFLEQVQADAQVEAAVRNYEMAYRMQAAVPDLCDLRGETEATKKLYGLDSADKEKAAYAKQCLLSRRLVERGVRFIELTCLSKNIGAGNAANPWDQHGKIKEGHGAMAHQVDQPLAALITDLKARGLFEETLIVWAGEFGRTPFSQGSDGRDHNPYGFSIWLAGGGIKGGTVYGATDDLGYYAVENQCEVYDLWATVLHLLGLDHEKLRYRFSGRDFRLTDVHGRVLHDILV
ncbi:DUF1501 domain-containing protein [Phragmitibacter flavus]|uniref:DUF1501 domain-containing protein n=1 Tax=Phragmitibacter flavus TaxID=2576071 RepID=A0A5R8KF09_9BACT|nr:DUF1501 domain-containing protein [Phragmitibacter flavus]TLD70878.1 DUF1501 domain-containing protein [Phragmitibacter flavus]